VTHRLHRTRLLFRRDGTQTITGAIVNPGPWQQAGTR
jgi:hypothetical protein